MPSHLEKLLAVIRYATVVSLLLVTPQAYAQVLGWGVNGPTQKKMDVKPIFMILYEHGITEYRTNASLTDDTDSSQIQTYHTMVELAKTYHIHIKPILYTPFQYGDRTDRGRYPKGDRLAIYSSAFNRTYRFVSEFKNDLPDWELGNEINLLGWQHDAAGHPINAQGNTAAEFDTPLMNDWAAALRGMSDAIDKVNAENGLHLRRALNTTARMFGFLDFMASKGVKFEIISYHYYERLGTNPHHFYGHLDEGGFDLFKRLAEYKKAVVFNEVNCAEIYDHDYENEAGKPKTEKGFKSLRATLKYLSQQKNLTIEGVNIYELFDEPAKSPPENRFGLFYDLRHPKISFLILAQFAGGPLSAEEKNLLADRGLVR